MSTQEPFKRKTIVLESQDVDFNEMFSGLTIREAETKLTAFRLKFAEREILFGATVKIRSNWNGASVIVSRLESDAELENRKEQARIRKEKQAIANLKRADTIARKKAEAAAKQRAEEIAKCRKLLLSLGTDATVLATVLKDLDQKTVDIPVAE